MCEVSTGAKSNGSIRRGISARCICGFLYVSLSHTRSYCLWVEVRHPEHVYGLNSDSRLRNAAIKRIANIISAVFHRNQSLQILILLGVPISVIDIIQYGIQDLSWLSPWEIWIAQGRNMLENETNEKKTSRLLSTSDAYLHPTHLPSLQTWSLEKISKDCVKM